MVRMTVAVRVITVVIVFVVMMGMHNVDLYLMWIRVDKDKRASFVPSAALQAPRSGSFGPSAALQAPKSGSFGLSTALQASKSIFFGPSPPLQAPKSAVYKKAIYQSADIYAVC